MGKIKYFSMFNGIGGFQVGIENAFKKRNCQSDKINKHKEQSESCKCIGISEIDKYSNAIYKYQFLNHKNFGDAKRIVPEELPDFDLFVAGFPCQDFSIAGIRRGLEGHRGALFFEIPRILRVKKPKNFILENVGGLLSAGITNKDRKTIKGTKGFVFKVIITTLTELGYFVEWEVCNSVGFGVPQNRERVFIVGHLRNGRSRKIFPLQNSNKEILQKKPERNISGTLSTKNQSGQVQFDASTTLIMPDNSRPIRPSVGRPTLDNKSRDTIIGVLDNGKFRETESSLMIDANYSKGRGLNGQRPMVLEQVGNIDTKGHNSIWGRVYSPEGIAPNLNAEGGGLGTKTGLYAIASRGRGEGWKQQYEARKDNLTNSLTGVQKDNMLTDGMRIRRLTPIECERLQAFPDSWTKYGINEKGETIEISDSQRYKVLGNAVTTVVVEELIRRLYNL